MNSTGFCIQPQPMDFLSTNLCGLISIFKTDLHHKHGLCWMIYPNSPDGFCIHNSIRILYPKPTRARLVSRLTQQYFIQTLYFPKVLSSRRPTPAVLVEMISTTAVHCRSTGSPSWARRLTAGSPSHRGPCSPGPLSRRRTAPVGTARCRRKTLLKSLLQSSPAGPPPKEKEEVKTNPSEE